MSNRPLGGLSTPARYAGISATCVAAGLLFMPQTHQFGLALLALLIVVGGLMMMVFPEKAVAVDAGALHVRTREFGQSDRWAARVADIQKIRIVGTLEARKLIVHFGDGSTATVKPLIGSRQNRKLEHFLTT